MIHLDTDIEGKQMTFGYAEETLKRFGLVIGSSWEYHHGVFDGILHRKGGETIYVRLPFQVIDGELDRADALIEFEQPFIVKHVVNLGIDKSGHGLLTVAGLGQFQKPLDRDGHIHNKNHWEEFGEDMIANILDDVSF